MAHRLSSKAKYNLILFILNIIYIFFIGLFAGSIDLRFIYFTLISLIYIASIFTIKSQSKLYFYLPTLMVALTWLSQLLHFPYLSEVTGIVSTLFFLGIIVMLVIRVAESHKVGILEFLESINIYLLIGIAASVLFGAVYSMNSDAFSASTGTFSSQADFIYFSFVTMTTLGYGDILPVSPLARSFTIFFSVTGQLYLAMIVAMLIGKYLNIKK